MNAVQQPGELLVVGSINMDLVFQTSRLPSLGETVIGGSFCQINGGKGANQAVAAARGSNVPVKLFAAVGGDGYATSIMESFKLESRLSVALIQQVADAQGALFSDLVMLKTEKRIAFTAILTQEQLDKLEELHAAIADRRGDRNEVEELDR